LSFFIGLLNNENSRIRNSAVQLLRAVFPYVQEEKMVDKCLKSFMAGFEPSEACFYQGFAIFSQLENKKKRGHLLVALMSTMNTTGLSGMRSVYGRLLCYRSSFSPSEKGVLVQGLLDGLRFYPKEVLAALYELKDSLPDIFVTEKQKEQLASRVLAGFSHSDKGVRSSALLLFPFVISWVQDNIAKTNALEYFLNHLEEIYVRNQWEWTEIGALQNTLPNVCRNIHDVGQMNKLSNFVRKHINSEHAQNRIAMYFILC